ncbi:MAG: cysteine methyltransferase [Cenarchaeum symbiont of Oopsacas minuta]|nr:cysteine methyltransferase [Cenarchaeum symbiont of Oopsacas minuta]
MSELALRVYEKLKKVPKGRVTTYAELARAVGIENGQRAIGNIMNKNPTPITIPCHRVVRSDGSVGGYAFGEAKKRLLLSAEGVIIKDGHITNMKDTVYYF